MFSSKFRSYGFFSEDLRFSVWEETDDSNSNIRNTGYEFNPDYVDVYKTPEKLFRRGIKPSSRPQAWMSATGASELQLEYPELYTFLRFREESDRAQNYNNMNNEILGFVSIIEKDIYRTFPNNCLFQPSPQQIDDTSITYEGNQYLNSLRRILVSFAYFSWEHPDPSKRRLPLRCSYQIGYCQSLNYIIGMLLLVFTCANRSTFCEFTDGQEHTVVKVEEQVFWMIVAIVENIMPSEAYGVELKGAISQQDIFWKHIIPNHGEDLGLGPFLTWLNMNKADARLDSLSMVTNSWFMLLFVGALPANTLFRVWDCLFFQGEKLLFKTALAILTHAQDDIIRSNDYCDAWKSLKASPQSRFDENRFINLLFKRRVRRRNPIQSFYSFIIPTKVEIKITARLINACRMANVKI